MVTTWFYLAVGALFFYLLMGKSNLISDKSKLKKPILWYLAAAFVEAGFTLFRAINVSHPMDRGLTEIWASGIQWLVVGISLLLLTLVLIENKSDNVKDA